MLSAYCEDLIRNRLSKLSGVESELIVLPSNRHEVEQNAAPWVVMVTANSKQFKLTFRSHFSEQNARVFANHCFIDQEFDDTKIAGFMKEFANQCAGALKRVFEEQMGHVDSTLPMLVRSQDDEPSSAEVPDFFEEFWQLHVFHIEINCAVTIEIFDKDILNQLWLPAFMEIDCSGEVEFL